MLVLMLLFLVPTAFTPFTDRAYTDGKEIILHNCGLLLLALQLSMIAGGLFKKSLTSLPVRVFLVLAALYIAINAVTLIFTINFLES